MEIEQSDIWSIDSLLKFWYCHLKQYQKLSKDFSREFKFWYLFL